MQITYQQQKNNVHQIIFLCGSIRPTLVLMSVHGEVILTIYSFYELLQFTMTSGFLLPFNSANFGCCKSSKAWNWSLWCSNTEMDITVAFKMSKLGIILNLMSIQGREGSQIIPERRDTELDHVLVEKIAQLDQAGACPWPGRGQSVGLRPVLDIVKPAGQQASITDLKGWRHGHLWGPYRPCYAGVQLRLARASATAIATVAVLHGGDYPDQWGW